MPVSLKKSPLFCMLDTETIYLKNKKAYEIGYIIFDSVTCEPIISRRFLIKETILSALWYTATNSKTPIFWPDKMNMALSLKNKDCLPCFKVLEILCNDLSQNSVSALIAHNINFDLSALYSTEKAFCGTPILLDKIGNLEKLELSGFFVNNLAKNVAFNVPFKAKSGCLTFKADFLVPYLVGGIQAHDALGDCKNQIALYKLTKGKYQNQGTIFSNMKKYHALQHEGELRLGNYEIE